MFKCVNKTQLNYLHVLDRFFIKHKSKISIISGTGLELKQQHKAIDGLRVVH